MWNVFVDGDNIPVNRYVCNIQNVINEFTRESPKPIIFCQSNLVFKSREGARLSLGTSARVDSRSGRVVVDWPRKDEA